MRFLVKCISQLEASSTHSAVKMILSGNQLSYRKILQNFLTPKLIISNFRGFPCFLWY